MRTDQKCLPKASALVDDSRALIRTELTIRLSLVVLTVTLRRANKRTMAG